MTTKSGDLPATPLANGADGSPWMINDLGNPALVIGLTKREQFAAMAMQGLLSGNNSYFDIYETSEEWVKNLTEASVEFADELLAELERTK